MKNGINRKIDELGRIVIPIEIRKFLKLNMGDSVEIYVEDNKIMLKRHSSMLGLEQFLFNIAKIINELCNATILFLDYSNIIVSYGKLSENYIDKTVDLSFYNKIENDNIYKCKDVNIIQNYIETRQCYVFTLYNKNSIVGLMIVIENETSLNNAHIEIINQFKKFIVKQLDS